MATNAAEVLAVAIREAAHMPRTAPAKQAGALQRNCSIHSVDGDFPDCSATATASISVLQKKKTDAPASVGTTSAVPSCPMRSPPTNPAVALATAAATTMLAMLKTVR